MCDTKDLHEMYGGACPNCCSTCNFAMHICMKCGEQLRHDGTEWRTKTLHPNISKGVEIRCMT